MRILLVAFILTFWFFANSQGVQNQYGFTDGKVEQILSDDSFLYLGGSFVRAFDREDVHGNGIVTNLDGTLQPGFPFINSRVRHAIPDNEGGWYIAGDFSYVGEIQQSYLAHILSDNSVDTSFTPSISHSVYTMTLIGDSLMIGGQFVTVNGASHKKLAKIHKSSGEVGGWNPSIENGMVHSIAPDGDSVLVGGSFTLVEGSISRSYIAKYSLSDGVLGDFAPNYNHYINDIAIYGDSLFVGGIFTQVNGLTRNRLVKIHKTSGEASLTWDPDADRNVNKLAIHEGELFAVGYFGKMSGQFIDVLAKIDLNTGEPDAAVDINSFVIKGDIKRVNSIAFDEDHNMIVGGYFQMISGKPSAYIAKLSPTGELIESFDFGLSDQVQTIAVSGNQMFVGGDFTAAGGQTRIGLARYDHKSGELSDWEMNTDFPVYVMKMDGDSMLIGGNFNKVNGEARIGLARFDRVTGNLGSWSPSASGLRDIIIDGDSLLIGGNFTSVGGVSRSRLAKIHKYTGEAGGWSPTSNSIIYDLEMDGDSVILSGGFTTINGVNRSKLAKVHKSTGELSSWAPQVDNYVWDMQLDGDSLFIGGFFNNVNGASRKKLAKLHKTTGELSPSWIADANNTVYDLIVEGNEMYVAGWFSSINGAPAHRLALLDKTSGNVNTNFKPLLNGPVLDITKNGDWLLLGGNFTYAKGVRMVGSAVMRVDNDVEIEYNGYKSQSGDTLRIDEILVDSTSTDYTVTIKNTSIYSTLNLSGFPRIELNGTHQSDYGIDSAGLHSVLNPDESTTFQINFTPSGGGLRSASIVITNDTPDEETFVINLAGLGKKHKQQVTFDELDPMNVNDENFTLSAVSDQGLSVSFKSSDTTIAKVVGSEVEIVGGGICQITAIQAGNEVFLADSVVRTLVVSKVDQSITFNQLSDVTFGEEYFVLTGQASSSLDVVYESSNSSVIMISNDTAWIVGGGESTITASQIGNHIYNAATPIQQEVLVNKSSQSITFELVDQHVYTDGNLLLSATSTSGLNVIYTSSDTSIAKINGDSLILVELGEVIVTAHQAGNMNYEGADSVQQTISIQKGSQLITFNELDDMTFGQDDLLLSGFSSAQLIVEYSSSNQEVAQIEDGVLSIVGAGTTIITASQGGNETVEAAVDVDQSLTVLKVSQQIDFDSLDDRSFGDDAFILLAQSSSGLEINYHISDTSIAKIDGGKVIIVGVGETTVTARQSGDNNYFAAEDVTRDLNISKGNQHIEFSELASKKYGDSSFTLEGTSSANLEVSFSTSDTSVLQIEGSLATILKPGVAVVSARQAGNELYTAAETVTQELTIEKLDQVISFDSISAKSFGDENFELVASSDAGLIVTYSSSDTTILAIDGNIAKILKAGLVTVTASQEGNDYYNAAENVLQELGIDKLNQLISFDTISTKTYGNEPFRLSASSSSGLDLTFVIEDTTIATVIGNTVTVHRAGETTVTAMQHGDANYIVADPVEHQLIVAKSSQTITFNDISEKSISDESFELVATSSSDLPVSFVSSDVSVVSIEGNVVTIQGAGIAIITAIHAGNQNYLPANSVHQSIEIAGLTHFIKFDEIPTKTFGAEPFELNAFSNLGLEVTYLSMDTSLLKTEEKMASIMGAGKVEVVAMHDGNDTINSTSDTIVVNINKATQTIEIEAPETMYTTSDPFHISAGSSSQLPISIQVTGVATIDQNGLVTLTGEQGMVEVTVVQNGNANYHSVDTAFSFEVMLNQTLSTPLELEITVFPNPVTDYLKIRGSGSHAVVLMDANGKILSRLTDTNEIDMTGLSKGMYLVQIITQQQQKTIRVVKRD
ncbi:MAG: T9SS type A sorting domain-containing protein [Cyclobacteriaceae bacterium]